jgi:hypothetical protein
MLQLYLRHDFYNVVFKMKHEVPTVLPQGKRPLPPPPPPRLKIFEYAPAVIALVSSIIMTNIVSSYSVVDIAIKSWTVRDSNPRQGQEILSSQCPDQFWGPPSLLFSGYRCSYLRVKRQGLEVNHHLHLVPRLRMGGGSPLLPLHACMAWKWKLYLFTLVTSYGYLTLVMPLVSVPPHKFGSLSMNYTKLKFRYF